MAQRRVAHQREGAPVVLDLRLRGRVALGRKAMAMAVQPDLDAGCLQLACLLQSHEGAEALRFYRRGIDVEGRAETAKQRLARIGALQGFGVFRSEEHTSELQSLMRTSYAVFCLKKKNNKKRTC